MLSRLAAMLRMRLPPGRASRLRSADRASEDAAAVGPLRPDLDEARGAEVTVECKRLVDPALPHHREAGRVDKRVGTLIVAAQPGPGIGLCRLADMDDQQARRPLGSLDECPGLGMAQASSEEGPRFADDMVGGQQTPGPVPPTAGWQRRGARRGEIDVPPRTRYRRTSCAVDKLIDRSRLRVASGRRARLADRALVQPGVGRPHTPG